MHQWHMVFFVIGRMLFVTSHYDIKSSFPILHFAKAC